MWNQGRVPPAEKAPGCPGGKGSVRKGFKKYVSSVLFGLYVTKPDFSIYIGRLHGIIMY